jgi:12-oxophytodienoic acid reductase
VRLSPFASYSEPSDYNQKLLALYMAHTLNEFGILYCHVVEPRMATLSCKAETLHRIRPMRDAFKGTFIVAGGYVRMEMKQSPVVMLI